jgi:hypothetical protein
MQGATTIDLGLMSKLKEEKVATDGKHTVWRAARLTDDDEDRRFQAV